MQRWRAHLLTGAYAAVGFAGVLVIVASAPVWRNAESTWRLTVPGIPHPPQSSLHAAVLFFGGLALMWIGWVGLLGRTERMPGSQRRRLLVVAAVLGLWCIPPLLSTPLLSNDAYAYAAQGQMASEGIDPTDQGAYSLHRGPFLNAVDPIWRDSPAPYGPVAVQLSAWAAEGTGQDPADTVWVMRFYAFGGVLMTAAGVVLLARQHRISASAALVAGVGGPLVLLHMVGGSHNDALMMGFLALGMAAFGSKRRVLSVVLVVAAVGVKLPAAVALAFIGWNWSEHRDAPVGSRLVSCAAVGSVALALLAVQSAIVGIGAGWITALSSTGTVTSTFSVSTKLGYLAYDATSLLGLDISDDAMVATFRLLGLAAAGAICAWLLWNSPRLGAVRAVGLAMVVTVLLGPVVWPWYLPAGLALLAASGLGRWRPSYLVLVIAASLFVFPSSVDPVHSLEDRGHLLGLAFLAVILVAAWSAQRLSVRMAAWRAQRPARQLERRAVSSPTEPALESEPGAVSATPSTVTVE